MYVIFSGKNHSETRNKIVSILSKFSTNEINLEIKLVKGGWARSLRQCIYVEESGNFADIELVISYLEGFCMDDFELSFPDGSYAYFQHVTYLWHIRLFWNREKL